MPATTTQPEAPHPVRQPVEYARGRLLAGLMTAWEAIQHIATMLEVSYAEADRHLAA